MKKKNHAFLLCPFLRNAQSNFAWILTFPMSLHPHMLNITGQILFYCRSWHVFHYIMPPSSMLLGAFCPSAWNLGMFYLFVDYKAFVCDTVLLTLCISLG
ncbi:unnamed protein product [Lepidochelys olivacea]